MLFRLCVYLCAFWRRNLTNVTRTFQSSVNRPLARKASVERFFVFTGNTTGPGVDAVLATDEDFHEELLAECQTDLARYPSGKGGACKALIMGSIPIRASTIHTGRKKGGLESPLRVQARNRVVRSPGFASNSVLTGCSIGSMLYPLFASGK